MIRCLVLMMWISVAHAQSISISAPTAGQTVSVNVPFNLQVNVTGNVAKVVYWVDNWSWLGEVTTAPFTLTWTPALSQGTHTLKARAIFGNGASLDAADVSFVIGEAPVSNNVMKLGTNFWFLASWSGETPFKTGINWATAYSSGADVWNTTFINELAPYGTLRFMDWGAVNNSNVTTWSQRRLPTDPLNADIGLVNPWETTVLPGLAYEWMIDLCNRTNKDMWVCLPHKTDAEYWSQLAALIHQKLNAHLKVYVEYSNETWNGGFAQFQWCLDKGIADGLPGDNQWYKGGAYGMWQSLKIFKEFQTVFGAPAMGNRVIRVFAASGNYDIAAQAFTNVMQSAGWNQGQRVDMFAIAPYVGSDIDGNAPNASSLFHADIDLVFNERILPAETIANNNGVTLGCYEGGQHLLTNANAWSANPLIYDEYLYMLNKWKPKFNLFMHYAHCGAWSVDGAWGAKQFTGQTLNSAPKYKALVDWVAMNPPCEATLSVNTTLTGTSVMVASQTIVAPPTVPAGQTNLIESAANITYRAGKSVQLNPGFHARSGAVFKALIGGCN